MRFWQFLFGGALVVLALVGFSHVQRPANAQSYETPSTPSLTLIWQSEVTRDAMIIAPSDLAVDDQGNVYVSMNGTKQDGNIKKFDSEGRLIAQWGSSGTEPGQFGLSTGLDISAEGELYVADFNNTRVQKFDSEGNFLLQWPTAPPVGPASVAVDLQGGVYVNNFSPRQFYIQKFDTSGELLLEWGSRGTGDGQFRQNLEDIAVDQDGNLYVTDRQNHRIQKFAPDGSFLAAFGGERSREGNGLFSETIGVAVDLDGNLYVMDFYYLQKLAPDGTPIAQWSITEGGLLDRARGIVAVDQEYNIYVFAYGTAVSEAGDPITPLVVKKISQS